MNQIPHWTSAMVAAAFGVGVSSIKRWTDEGRLQAVKTAGGHRRYRVEDIHEFARENGYPTDVLPPVPDSPLEIENGASRLEALIDALRFGETARADALVTWELSRTRDRTLVLDRFVGAAMREIGILWERGELPIDEEHRATNIVTEILARQSRVRIDEPAGTALLTCPPGEQHELPLRLVKLVLEWNDWNVQYLGANVPWESIARAVVDLRPGLLLMSSRGSEPFEGRDFRELARLCEELEIPMGVGGNWARGGPGADRSFRRFRTLKGFEGYLRKWRA